MRLSIASMLAPLLLIGSTAGAAVVSGAVTGGGAYNSGGTFVKLQVPFDLSNPDNTVGNDNFNSENLFAFDEAQNIIIDREIQVDIGTKPIVGDIVASHYVFFDSAVGQRQVGYIDFDADIYGIATSKATLAASDFLANTNVTYLNANERGLEYADYATIDPNNHRRLHIDWWAGTPGDYVRVFTMESPDISAVPLPASLLMLGAALGLLPLARLRHT